MINLNKAFPELQGKIINELRIANHRYEPGQLLAFMANDRIYVFQLNGGCACDPAWVEHIAGIKNLLNHKIIETRLVSAKEVNLKPDDYCQIYSIKIITNIGHCDIEFRHEHNGYYGTYLTYLDGVKKFTDLNDRKNLSYISAGDCNFKSITNDF